MDFSSSPLPSPPASSRPRLSLNICTAVHGPPRPLLSLRCNTPIPSRAPVPIVPSPVSPIISNTGNYQHGFAVVQQPQIYAYNYVNYCTAKSILKKTLSTSSISSTSSSPSSLSSSSSSTSTSRGDRVRQLSFVDTPIVYCVSPIEDEDYYGQHTKMTREERRWLRR